MEKREQENHELEIKLSYLEIPPGGESEAGEYASS